MKVRNWSMDTPSSIYRSSRWYPSKHIGYPAGCPVPSFDPSHRTKATPMSVDLQSARRADTSSTEAPMPEGGRESLFSRTLEFRAAGRRHGPVTRVFSPGDIGEPHQAVRVPGLPRFHPDGRPLFPMHPHSGIATTTVLLSGRMRHEDTTGAHGEPARRQRRMDAGRARHLARRRAGRFDLGSGATSSGWRCRKRWKARRPTASTSARKPCRGTARRA